MNRRTKLLATVTGAALLAGGIVYAAMPADAATADVQFSRINYDSPGKDTRSNASLVAEYVRLTNRSPFAVNISRWTLVDKSGHKFTFPNHTLAAHKTVYVHTGRGTNGRNPAGKPDAPHLYWNSGNYVWNNDGDTATIRSGSGRVYDTCSWKAGGTATSCNFKAPAPLKATTTTAKPSTKPVPSPPPQPRPTTTATTVPPAHDPAIPPADLPTGGGDPADNGLAGMTHP
jgi:hypothetical protein